MKRGKGRKAATKRVKLCREGTEGCCEEKERKAAVHEERERKAALKRGKGEKLFMVHVLCSFKCVCQLSIYAVLHGAK